MQSDAMARTVESEDNIANRSATTGHVGVAAGQYQVIYLTYLKELICQCRIVDDKIMLWALSDLFFCRCS